MSDTREREKESNKIKSYRQWIPINQSPHLHSKSLVISLNLSGNGTGFSDGTLTETILETTGQILEMTHTASSGGLSSLALDAPVEGTELGSGVTALGTGLLLLVVGTVTAAFAEGVGLSMAFTKAGSSLSLKNGNNKITNRADIAESWKSISKIFSLKSLL